MMHFSQDDLCKRRLRRQKKAKEEARHDNKCKSKMTSFTGIKQPQTENGMFTLLSFKPVSTE
jgi:hypothetical protein